MHEHVISAAPDLFSRGGVLRPKTRGDGGKEARVVRARGQSSGRRGGCRPWHAVAMRVGNMVGLLAFLLLIGGQAGAQAASPYGCSVNTNPSATPPRPRPRNGLDALNQALAFQRRGELEEAAAMLREARTQEATLTLTERQELARLIEVNQLSLQSRQQAQG